MNDTERHAIEADCSAVALRFFRALDLREHETLVGLMAPDGVWDRQGTLLSGREAVRGAMAKRPAARKTCHLVSNIVVDVLSADRAKVHFILIPYDGESESGPPPAKFLGIRFCTDVMVRLPEGWRIAEKATRVVLTGGA